MRALSSAPQVRRVIVHSITFTLVAGAGVAIAVLPASPAFATSNTPANGSVVIGPGCLAPAGGSFAAAGATPSMVNSGDYSGGTSYGNPPSNPYVCTDSTWYKLDVSGSATTTFEWYWGDYPNSGGPDLRGLVCSVWAYIPTVDAGDRDARYDIWGWVGQGVSRNWLFWPGHTIDQENTSGWISLGSHSMGKNSSIEITLNNSDSTNPGWYTGAGDMAISCVPPTAPPPVPAGVTATATSPNSIHVSWTDNASGNAEDIVTDGPTNSPVLGYGSTSYDWTGLVPGTYRCSAVQAGNLAGWSAFSGWQCATTPVPVATGVTATATSPTSIALKWTDNTGGTAKYLVTDGSGDYSPTLSAGTTSYTWTTGLTSNTYKCLTVMAEGPNANSGWSQYACVTTPWSETDARNDLLTRLKETPLTFQNRLTAAIPGQPGTTETMDTAKILQTSPGNYIAVYTGGASGNEIHLATSTDLTNWTFVARLDTSATQPNIAAGPNGSFVVADEEFDVSGATSGASHVKFLYFNNLADLNTGNVAWITTPAVGNAIGGFSSRFFSNCNEGTPDIHGISGTGGVGTTVNFGFHWNSNPNPVCFPQTSGPDREAFGTFTVQSIEAGEATSSWSRTQDTVRDNAAASLGYTGSRGGRDDITWHGWRFSIQEAQCGSQITSDCTVGDTSYDYTSWRFILYDYSNQTAYPAAIPPAVESVGSSEPLCHGNPKVTALNDPNGNAILVVTGFIFGPPGGCVPSGSIAGEFLYTVPAG